MSVTQPEDRSPVPGSLLPIRTVAHLTGVNPVTLRAWERRYRLITPQRTPKGHRLYTGHDVERIRNVLGLLEQGISIGQVKPLLDRPVQQPVSADSGPGESWRSHQDNMLRAIADFDEPALETSYNEILSLYPVDIVIQQLITPLLRTLGERWQDSDTGIAEEHFFSVFLRNKLGARIHHVNPRSRGPLLLLACLPGEQHELGLLFFALASLDYGYRILVLGANTPLEQLPGVLQKRPCAGIVLSCSHRPARAILEIDLPALIEKVDVPVFAGGRITPGQQTRFEAAGAICVGALLADSLRQISRTLKTD